MKAPARERLQLLRSVPLFRSCSDRDLARIDGLVDDIEVPAGEVLTREGDPGSRESFVVVDGEAAVTIDGRHIATLGPGDLFGEMASLDRAPRAATVTATSPMHLLVIDPADFSAFLEMPGIAKGLLAEAVGRLRTTEAS